MAFYAAISISTGDGAMIAIDGDLLVDTDVCLTLDGTRLIVYSLDADSGLPVSSPDVLAPTDNAGTKRWILQDQGDVLKSTFDANTILYATTDNTPAALTVAASRIIGRKASGAISALTAAEVLTILDLTVSAFAKTILDDAAAGNVLTTLGVSAFIQTLLNDADAATARNTLGVVESTWTQTTGTFTATPASTSTVTMTEDLTATLLVGIPLKYVIGGTTYYGIVSAIASNLLTVAGAPLSGDVTALYYGDRSRVNQANVIIPGLYEDASNTDLIGSDLASKLIWNKAKAYLVRYRVYSAIHDSGTHGQASVQINNTEVNTTAGGLTIAADATWYATVVDIAVAAYDVNPGEEIEVTAVKAGTGDASDLTVELTFVLP